MTVLVKECSDGASSGAGLSRLRSMRLMRRA